MIFKHLLDAARRGVRVCLVADDEDLKRKIEAVESKYDEQFRFVYEAITNLIEEDEKPKKKIGHIKEGHTKYGKRSRKKNQITNNGIEHVALAL